VTGEREFHSHHRSYQNFTVHVGFYGLQPKLYCTRVGALGPG